MLTIRIPSLGEVFALLETLMYDDGLFHLRCTHDIILHCSRISLQDDFIYEYGWIHIQSYTINGETTSCDYCTSIG